jgi:hypothetical protein
MRLWSLHPKYLDAKGLVALWRETLLAKHVLEGKTKGYKNHPQLNRFKKTKDPVNSINHYLSVVYEEAIAREYSFDKTKIKWGFKKSSMNVTSGQIDYELKHLKTKLSKRDPEKLKEIKKINTIDTHPMFKIKKGEIEDWEIIN